MRTVFSAVLVLFLVSTGMGKEAAMNGKTETAVLAGGCFWCMEPPFDGKPGVISTRAGYAGGKSPNPTYEEVCTGKSGHLEVVEVVFDPAKISYAEILESFWRSVDPTDPGGQFADRGEQYQTAIFVLNEEQRRVAEESKKKLASSGVFSRPIAVQIRPAAPFYPAEEYHQKYYCKRPAHYNAYKEGSGRADFLEKTWKSK